MIRLLDVYTLQLREFQENNVPPYAIASHRWLFSELTYRDVLNGRVNGGAGSIKLQGFCSWIRGWQDSLPDIEIRWLWYDACCIDKDSSAELSEAINSMYSWYAQAEICIAYLVDVFIKEPVSNDERFEDSEWFRRGWTLQELIAPSMVVFLDRYFQTVGHKRAATEDVCGLPQHLLGPELNNVIAQCTGISKEVLRDAAELDILSVEARLAWVESRTTTKTEDQAYCLLGIFNVHMPLIYGEGQQATTRLFEENLEKAYPNNGRVPDANKL